MTDNEIIRIAENCCSDKPNCTCCPFDVGTNTVGECMEKLIQHCVDLINRQKAEIAVLKSDLILKTNDYELLKSAYEKAENVSVGRKDRLMKAVVELQEAKAEIERKSNLLGEAVDRFAKMKEAMERKRKFELRTVESEAIKEFAERLKKKYKHNKTSITSLVTLFDNINNLVNEMCGE